MSEGLRAGTGVIIRNAKRSTLGVLHPISNTRRDMRKTIKRLFLYDTEPLETWLDLAIASWGIYLVLPFDTFASSPTYRGISGLVPENVLGLSMIVIAMTQFFGIGASHMMRRYALLAGSTICLFIMLTFVYSNPQSTGIPTFFALSMGCLFSYIKVTSNL